MDTTSRRDGSHAEAQAPPRHAPHTAEAAERGAAGPEGPAGVALAGALPYGQAVQARASGAHAAPAGGGEVAVASAGVAGGGGALPYLGPIQAAFGAHDVSSTRAHVGGAAGDAAQAIGAEAYTVGRDVAFAGPPSLHTAAHEAAHVVQQQRGVHLKGGVGAAGDAYERHADAVADRVVAGRPAADLLGALPAGGGAPGAALQRKQAATPERTLAALKKTEFFKKKLAGKEKNPQGQTLEEHILAVLANYSAHFALPGTDGDAGVVNEAMLLAGTISSIAAALARELNDPTLKPLIADSLLAEYRSEISSAMAKGKGERKDDKTTQTASQEESEKALALAKVLVGDDPVTLYLFNKTTGPDAVQRVRDMAVQAGLKPSRIFRLLRQQVDMELGAYTYQSVQAGRKKKDAARGNFDLNELIGELDPDVYKKMLDIKPAPVTDLKQKKEPDRPEWKGGAGGLKFGKEAQDKLDWLETQVTAWDTEPTVVPPTTTVPTTVPTTPTTPWRRGLKPGEQQNLMGSHRLPPPEPKVPEAPDPKKAPKKEPYRASGKPYPGQTTVKPEPKKPKAPTTTDKRPLTDQLREGATKLKSPTDRDYVPAPGLGQTHKVRGPLGEGPEASTGGALNERQYAHLRRIREQEQDDAEELRKASGKTVRQFCVEKIAARYNVAPDKAETLLEDALRWLSTVPLTVTFNAANMFSVEGKNAPKYGTTYTSEVVLSRGTRDMKDVTGRGNRRMNVTGGKDTGFVADRGENYMRWRREKDDREARLDNVMPEDQQIFGAANINLDKLKGGARGREDGVYGKNYYGTAHFKLKDEVRPRCLFVVRGGGTTAPVQRHGMLMLVYDMLRPGASAPATYLDAILANAKGKAEAVVTGLDFEMHLYGGFDIVRDAAKIYVGPDLAPAVLGRLTAFATTHGITVENYGTAPPGLEIKNKVEPKNMNLI